MAFFKTRKASDEPQAARDQAESIEAMRRRAKHRLIGASVLVLIGVIGFPLLFDTQPRPIPVDIPIEIPDRNQVKPLAMPPQSVTQTNAVSGSLTAASAPENSATARPASTPAPVAVAASSQAQPQAKPEPTPEPKPDSRSAKPEPKIDDGSRAQALLEGKPTQIAALEGRFVVQVGAFADAAKAREARLRVERAGLRTYTQVTDTKDGKRIRVRAGPFRTRAEADKAAETIKGLDLPTSVLSL
jgi:DedD protein